MNIISDDNRKKLESFQDKLKEDIKTASEDPEKFNGKLAAYYIRVLDKLSERIKKNPQAWDIYFNWMELESDERRFNPKTVKESFEQIRDEISEQTTPISFKRSDAYRLAETVRIICRDGEEETDRFQQTMNDFLEAAQTDELIQFIEWIYPEIKKTDFVDNEAFTESFLLKNLRNYGFQHDKLSRQMVKTDPTITNGVSAWAVDKSPKKKDSKVPVYASIAYINDNAKLPANVSAFDISLINAIGTIWHNSPQRGFGTVNMSVGEIFRVMRGITDSRKSPSKLQSDEICKAINRLMYSEFYLDFSKEIEAYNLKIDDDRIINGRVKTNMLHAYEVKVKTIKGREIIMYRIIDEPILYTYNRIMKHLIIVPYELLDVSDQTQLEGNTLEIRDYLICEIDSMYNTCAGLTTGRYNNAIKFQTMYETIGIQSPEGRILPENYKSRVIYTKALSREKKKDRDKVAAILESLKKKGFIRGYEINKSVPSVQITLYQSIIDAKKKAPLSWK